MHTSSVRPAGLGAGSIILFHSAGNASRDPSMPPRTAVPKSSRGTLVPRVPFKLEVYAEQRDREGDADHRLMVTLTPGEQVARERLKQFLQGKSDDTSTAVEV